MQGERLLCTDRKGASPLGQGAWGRLGGARAAAPVLQAIQEAAPMQLAGHFQRDLQQACTLHRSCEGLLVTELWVVKETPSQALKPAVGKHTQMMAKFVHIVVTKRLLEAALAGLKSNKLETGVAEAVSLNMQRQA